MSSSAQPTDTQQPSVDSNVRPDLQWPPVGAKTITCQVYNTAQLQLFLGLLYSVYVIGSLAIWSVLIFTVCICNAREYAASLCLAFLVTLYASPMNIREVVKCFRSWRSLFSGWLLILCGIMEQ